MTKRRSTMFDHPEVKAKLRDQREANARLIEAHSRPLRTCVATVSNVQTQTATVRETTKANI